jgi:type IV secretion system protein VirB9
MTRYLRACAIALAFAATAHAQSAPPAAPPDQRIRTIPYSDAAVIPLTGHMGFQITIEFDPSERIENVSIGDSLGWQVTPNRRGTLLFLKPVLARATTNMTVITSARRYVFDLRAAEARGPSDPAIVYVLRFRYPPPPEPIKPPPPPQPPPPPVTLNSSYTPKGSSKIAPLRLFDDGRFTYFEFPASIEAPVITALSPDGREGLVNARIDGALIVIDQIAPGFVLRHGKEKLTLTNDAFAQRGGR